MRSNVKVCAISLATVDGMIEANYLRAVRMVEIALTDAPDIVLLPEAFAAGYCGRDMARLAESRTSASLQRFRQLSREGHCMVVLGFLEKCADGVRNVVVMYDQGEEVGVHCKRTLWPDAHRDYRDEVSLLVPGKEMEIFVTRLGRCSVVICYENVVDENWAEIGTQVDFVLSPYNCQGDPSHYNVEKSRKYEIPSAWADRTGTVWAGDHYMPNPGTAGVVDARGRIVAKSDRGVEAIVVGTMDLGNGRGCHA